MRPNATTILRTKISIPVIIGDNHAPNMVPTIIYAVNTRLNTADQIYQSTTQQIMSAYDQYANSIDTQSAALSWVASSVKTQSLLLACIDYYWVVCILGITGATIMLKQNFMK